MLYSKPTLLAAVVALSSLVAAHPADLLRRVVSPDQTCGNVVAGANHGYTCVTGNCCSQYVRTLSFGLLQGIQLDSFGLPVLLIILRFIRVTAEPQLIIAGPDVKQPLG